MAKFSRCISEPKTLSRLPFFSLGILSKTRQLTAQKSKSSLAKSTRILIFLKPHTFLHELAASAQTKPVNLVTGTPLFWKHSPEPFKHPSTRIRIKKMCGFKNFWIPVDRPNFFLHLSRIAFVHRRWFSLTQLVGNPARLSSRKNFYYWATGSSVRQDMNNVTALKFQALCYWYLKLICNFPFIFR